MKLILWLDAQILKFFTKIAKDFNWLTGKDHFFLARVCVAVLVFIVIFFGYKKDWPSFVTGLVTCPIMWSIILGSESIHGIEQKLQIKSLSNHETNLVFRISYGLFLILGFILFGFAPSIIWIVAIMCAISYLISIDKPPFQKSQAWKKIRNWVGSLSAQPQAEPIPVRSN